MDFITSLPKLAGNFDSIFVIVDRLTKVAHLIPTRTTASASDIAQLFVKEIVRFHLVPARIISDKDAKFTSKFDSNFSIIGHSPKFKLSLSS